MLELLVGAVLHLGVSTEHLPPRRRRRRPLRKIVVEAAAAAAVRVAAGASQRVATRATRGCLRAAVGDGVGGSQCN